MDLRRLDEGDYVVIHLVDMSTYRLIKRLDVIVERWLGWVGEMTLSY